MTLSYTKIYLALLLCALSVTAFAADPPTAQLAAADAAIAAAVRADARGDAGQTLDEARQLQAQAQAAVARRKYKDALLLTESAAATADLATARAQLANAKIQFDEKSARNADLRRKLLVVPQQ